jgi:hypothetical protein
MVMSAILREAKAKLTPETWGKGDEVGREASERLCAAQAIDRAVMSVQGKLATMEGISAFGLLSEVATGSRWASIPKWNDRPETSLQDVLDAFDAAIAIAEAQEQAPLAREAELVWA